MGRTVCEAVLDAPDLRLVAAVDPNWAGVALADLLGPGAGDLTVAADLDEVAGAGAEVVVDFSVAEGARTTLAWCAGHGVHAVVGTTGLSPAELDQLSAGFGPPGPNALVAPNFALGAVLLVRLCELAAPLMDNVEIIELHHDQKVDAPSGTALATAARIAAARDRAGAGAFPPDPTTDHVLVGARGGEGPGGIRVHSVRLPGLVAHEEVIFGAEGQTLSLRHDAIDRRSFMPGVLLAVRAVPDRPGLTVGLDGLLGI
jgi:4-hydroxy-tetrahydrodipicolinate reductase